MPRLRGSHHSEEALDPAANNKVARTLCHPSQTLLARPQPQGKEITVASAGQCRACQTEKCLGGRKLLLSEMTPGQRQHSANFAILQIQASLRQSSQFALSTQASAFLRQLSALPRQIWGIDGSLLTVVETSFVSTMEALTEGLGAALSLKLSIPQLKGHYFIKPHWEESLRIRSSALRSGGGM